MKLGISCGAMVERYGYERAFSMCRKSGFDTVEVGLGRFGNKELKNDIYYASQDEFESFFTDIRKKAEAAGIEFSSVHGRTLTCTPNEEECEYARWVSEMDLKAAGVLGAPICVIHSIVNSHWPDRYDDEEFLYKTNADFFNYLAPTAEASNVKICLETYGKVNINGEFQPTFFSHPHQMLKQFETLKTNNKTICVDIGHTNEAFYRGASSPGEMIRYLGEKVTHLHLHDNNGTVDLHSAPLFDKRGCIDWEDVFDALDEINYTGVYNFEMNMSHYGKFLEDAIEFFGKYLRYVVETKGRVRQQ